jgi:hypothetical protein
LSDALIVTDWDGQEFPFGSKLIGCVLPARIVPELGVYGTGLHDDETTNDAV